MLQKLTKELQREHQMKKFRLQRMAEMGGWKYDQAPVNEREKKQWLLEQRREHQWPELTKELAALQTRHTGKDSLNIRKSRSETWYELSIDVHQRVLNSLNQSREADKLLPSRPLLRVKRT